jgi:DNA-binding beta-propeller fold protein YncE
VKRLLLFVALGAGCMAGESTLSSGRGSDVPNGESNAGAPQGAPLPACTAASSCPTGYTCDQGRCVPPENETDTSSPPAASPHYVYVLNPTTSSVARIEPATLAIESIPVGADPVQLVAIPGEDVAVVLSAGGASLSLIDSTQLPSRVLRLPIDRLYTRLAVSPDGAFAVTFSDVEGVISVIDLKALRAGRPVWVERAAGYRITKVVFRTEAGIAKRAHVFAKSTLTTFDLTDLSNALPTRLDLPASMSADVSSREVIATSDGHGIVLRTTTARELAFFDGTSLKTVSLPEVATDVELMPDGSAAIAAMRTSNQIAYVELPADLDDPSGIQQFAIAGTAVGQVVLPATADRGLFALIFSSSAADESFARLELPAGTVRLHPLEKWIAEISIAPDARSAVVIHRANPDSAVSDPYERAVDRDQGYSVVDLATGYSQLKRTGSTRPTRHAFSSTGGYAGVALRNDAERKFSIEAVNLSSLVSTPIPLASMPLFLGPVPQAPGISPHRVFVSQAHSAGRVSVIQLDTKQVRTVTGYSLNSEIE